MSCDCLNLLPKKLQKSSTMLYPQGLSLGLSPTDFQKIEYCKLLKSGFKYVSASFIHMILWAYNIISLYHRVKLLNVQISVVECHLNLHLNDQITKLTTDNNSHTHTQNWVFNIQHGICLIFILHTGSSKLKHFYSENANGLGFCQSEHLDSDTPTPTTSRATMCAYFKCVLILFVQFEAS